jgi:hypothetical protein
VVPDKHGDISWLHRFLDYLKAHGRTSDLAFMSFEHYPFDGCEHGAKLTADLVQEPSLIKTVVDAWHADGIPPSLPLYITEANFSAVNFTQTPMQIEGALWQADYMAASLFDGIDGVVYYQYEPVPLSQNDGCRSDWGNLTMFVADAHAHVRAFGAQYYGVQMLTKYWLHADSWREAELEPTSVPDPLISAYAARNPVDPHGRVSLLVINKDVNVHALTFGSPLLPGKTATFGPAQYEWRQNGSRSGPEPDSPPVVTGHCQTDDPRVCFVPARSISVIELDPARG